MKQMVYGPHPKHEVLAEDVFLGYKWIAKSLGTHPCGYVKIPEGFPLKTYDEFEENVQVHGGITFFSAGGLYVNDDGSKVDGEWIGWDYAHIGDYSGFSEEPIIRDKYPFLVDGTKKWTTAEIVEDCRNVIKQLIVIKDKAQMLEE